MDWKKAHFIGIGGVGMSAVAKLLKDAGVAVTGSDEEVYQPVAGMLHTTGLEYRTPYDAKNIPPDADLIVIGKNAKLVAETNAEVAAAYTSGKIVLSFPDVLAELSAEKETIVVAGSYGKSTCTALLAHCLEHAGKDPSYFIGASPITPATSGKMGAGPLFVMEGDEYPASNTDPRAKFLLMHPKHALITPLAHDHFNIFPTPADYLKPFYQLAKLLPAGRQAHNTLVVCRDGALSQEFITTIPPCTTYGLDDAKNIAWGEVTHLELDGMRLETTLLGTHNIQNIVGVWTLVKTLNLMTPQEFSDGVKTFKGIVRRLDRKSEATSIPVYEGFGSSYEKLQSAVAAMRLHFHTRRLVVVFEPNTISWRSRAALAQYDSAFNGAKEVLVFNPPHDGKETELSTDEIAARISKSGIPAKSYSKGEGVLTALSTTLTSNDCILLSSSGSMDGLAETVPKLCEELFPA